MVLVDNFNCLFFYKPFFNTLISLLKFTLYIRFEEKDQ